MSWKVWQWAGSGSASDWWNQQSDSSVWMLTEQMWWLLTWSWAVYRWILEFVQNFKFLDVHLKNESCSVPRHRLHWQQQQHCLPPFILTASYRGPMESILSCYISICYGNCTVSDGKSLQRLVKTAERIIEVSLPCSRTFSTHAAATKPPALCMIPHTGSLLSCHLAAFGPRCQTVQQFPQSIRQLNTPGLYCKHNGTCRWALYVLQLNNTHMHIHIYIVYLPIQLYSVNMTCS